MHSQGVFPFHFYSKSSVFTPQLTFIHRQYWLDNMRPNDIFYDTSVVAEVYTKIAFTSCPNRCSTNVHFKFPEINSTWLAVHDPLLLATTRRTLSMLFSRLSPLTRGYSTCLLFTDCRHDSSTWTKPVGVRFVYLRRRWLRYECLDWCQHAFVFLNET